MLEHLSYCILYHWNNARYTTTGFPSYLIGIFYWFFLEESAALVIAVNKTPIPKTLYLDYLLYLGSN